MLYHVTTLRGNKRMYKQDKTIIQREDGNLLSRYMKYGINNLAFDNKTLSSHAMKLYEFYDTNAIDGDLVIKLADKQFELWDTLHSKMDITHENVKNLIDVALEVPTSEASMEFLFNKIHIYLQILKNDKLNLNESLLSQHKHFQHDDFPDRLAKEQFSLKKLSKFDVTILSAIIENGPTSVCNQSMLSPHALGLYNLYNSTPNMDAVDIIDLLSVQYELWTILNDIVGLETNYRLYLYDIVFTIPTGVLGIFKTIYDTKRGINSLREWCHDLPPTDADIDNQKVVDELQQLQQEISTFFKEDAINRFDLPFGIRAYGHYLCNYKALNLHVNNLVFLDCLKAYKQLINCVLIDYSIPPNPQKTEVFMNKRTNNILITVDLVMGLQEKIRAFCLTYKAELPKDIYTHGLSLADTPVTTDIDQINQLFEELKQFSIMLQTNYINICSFDTFGWVQAKPKTCMGTTTTSTDTGSNEFPPVSDDQLIKDFGKPLVSGVQVPSVTDLLTNTKGSNIPISQCLDQHLERIRREGIGLTKDFKRLNIEDASIESETLPPNPDDVDELNRTIKMLQDEVSTLLDNYPDLNANMLQYGRHLTVESRDDYSSAYALCKQLENFRSDALRCIQYLPSRNTEESFNPDVSFQYIKLPDHIQKAIEEFVAQPENQSQLKPLPGITVTKTTRELLEDLINQGSVNKDTANDVQPQLKMLIDDGSKLMTQIDHYMAKYHTNFSESLNKSCLDMMDSFVRELNTTTIRGLEIARGDLIGLKEYLMRVYPTFIFDNFNTLANHDLAMGANDADEWIARGAQLVSIGATGATGPTGPIGNNSNIGPTGITGITSPTETDSVEMLIDKCYINHKLIRNSLIDNVVPGLIKPYVQILWDFTEEYLNKFDMNFMDQYNSEYIINLTSRLNMVLYIINNPSILNTTNVQTADILVLDTFEQFMCDARLDVQRIWMTIPKAKERVWQDGIDINTFEAGPRVSDLEHIKYLLGLDSKWIFSTNNESLTKHAENISDIVSGKSLITRELAVFLLELQIDLARLLSKPGINVLDMRVYTEACTMVPAPDNLKHNLVELCKKVSALKLDVTINNYGCIERSLFLN